MNLRRQRVIDPAMDVVDYQFAGEQDQKCDEQRHGDVLCKPASAPAAEIQGGEALQPALIQLARLVHAVEQREQPPVQAEKLISADEVLRILQVRKLELVP